MEEMAVLTRQAVDAYLEAKAAAGVSAVTVAKYRGPLYALCDWLGEDASVTVPRLQAWRKSLEGRGCGKATVQCYVKTVNGFLRASGLSSLCIPRPLQKDLVGKTFGDLSVLEVTDKRKRRDVLWRCRCSCGKEVEVPTVLLLGGNTTSCGCLNKRILRHVNQYEEGTSLRQSLENRPRSKNSLSGYTGVQPRRGKWFAYINYKGVRYHLGTYARLEDAVKARSRAKEWVMEDAGRIREVCADRYGQMPRRPYRRKKTAPAEE